jgi:hypothetical protein
LYPIEARVMSLMRTGEAPGSSWEQHPRPRNTLFIDLFVDAQSPLSPIWGPLRRLLAGRQIAVEVESGAISEEKLRYHIAKSLLATEAGRRGALVVICRKAPLRRLREFEAQEVEPGIWRIPTDSRTVAYLVVPELVGMGPGRAVIRMLFATSDPKEAEARKHHLLTDPGLPSDIKNAVWNFFKTREVVMGYEELAHLGMVEFHEASMRMGEERGRQEGEERGRQEGEERGRKEGEQREQRTLLSVASRMVSETELERLGALTLERLREEVEARIAALAAQQR